MAAVVERQLLSLPLPLLTEIFPNPFTRTRTRSAGLTETQTFSATSISDTSTTSSSLPTSSTESASSTISETSSTTIGSSSSSSTISTPIITPPVSTDLPLIVETGSNGDVFTVTVQETASPTPSVQGLPNNSSTGFLQNKVASGLIFSIIGIVSLTVMVTIVTFVMRHNRRRKLLSEAIHFDPSPVGGSPTEKGSLEKRRYSLLSYDNGHTVNSLPYMPSPPPHSYNARQGAYHLPPLPTFNNGQYAFNGLGGDNQCQQSYHGATASDSPYSGHILPPDTRSAWSYYPETHHPSSPAPAGREKYPVSEK